MCDKNRSILVAITMTFSYSQFSSLYYSHYLHQTKTCKLGLALSNAISNGVVIVA